MAKPNAPKELAPRADAEKQLENKQSMSIKTIIVNVLTTTLICLLFVLANYFIQDSLLTKKIGSETGENDVTAQASEHIDDRGVIVDLGDFTMNLSDPDSRRYLKVSVALELTKTPEDDAPAKKGGGHGGHGGGEPELSPVEKEMLQYKPAIRDAIISALSSKTSAELSTTAGKELAKDEIIDAVDSIFGGEREVIRVSFGQFIMQ